MDAGDEEAARVHLDHALEINPTMEEARRALRHLQARPVTTQVRYPVTVTTYCWQELKVKISWCNLPVNIPLANSEMLADI